MYTLLGEPENHREYSSWKSQMDI